MPQKTLPLIRRSVANSLENLQSNLQLGNEATKRSLRYESLEDRRVLLATGSGLATDPGSVESGLVTSGASRAVDQIQVDEITHLVVEVNGISQTLTPENNLLQLVAGDQVQVVEISFISDSSEGVFAAAGYLNKISDLTSASLIDYNDGRFSAREANQEATGGEGSIAGPMEGWKVEEGWDRMTINLMHYTANSSEVAGRFFVQMNVGQPDFQFDFETIDHFKSKEILVGDTVSIPARWMNTPGGQFHNYAEVDIYHSSNMDQTVWAGASVGNADSEHSLTGEFLNRRSDDSFTERWQPMMEGEFVLKYYLDPEGAAAN